MGMKHETHDIWGTQLYWGTIGLRRRTELYHANPTFEIDEKLRWGISHILRIPCTPFGIFFGKWQKTRSGTEEEAILKALSGRDLKEDEWSKHQARVTVAKRTTSLDDEWKIVDALGLVS